VYRVSVALADSLSNPVTVTLDLTPTPHQYVPPVTPLGEDKPFGYVVPVVRGHMTGRVSMNGRTIELDGTGFGLGKRSQRFSAVADDRVVKELNVEAKAGEVTVSAAEKVCEL